jgi:hypothetical protein
MAISTTTNKRQYACNGSTTQFDLDIKIFDEDDITVYIKNITTGAQTILTQTTEYTVDAISGDYENGARITTVATYSSDYQITLIRTVANTQGLDLVEGGDLPAMGLENALDRTVMQVQQLDEKFGRTITAPPTDPEGLSYEIDPVETRASKALGFDENGNFISVSLADSGAIAVDSQKGLDLTNNIISAKVDNTSIEFDAQYKISVKDGGVDTAQIADGAVTETKIADGAVTETKIGMTKTGVDASLVSGTAGAADNLAKWNSDGDAVDSGYGVINEDDMASDSATDVPTQQSVKAYVKDEILTLTAAQITMGAGEYTHVLAEKMNLIDNCYISSGNLILPAGTYHFQPIACTSRTENTSNYGTMVLRIYVDNEILVTGNVSWMNCHSDSATSSFFSKVDEIITITEETEFVFKTYCTLSTTSYLNLTGHIRKLKT